MNFCILCSRWCLTGTGRDTGVGVTWEYMFMGIGMKTGTGMGTGIYSLLTPSSTSRKTNIRVQEKLAKAKAFN